MTVEGWRTVDPFDIAAVYRGEDEWGGVYARAVVMSGGEEIAGIVRAAVLARIEAQIAKLPPAA
jgi:hypothetical protein